MECLSDIVKPAFAAALSVAWCRPIREGQHALQAFPMYRPLASLCPSEYNHDSRITESGKCHAKALNSFQAAFTRIWSYR